MYIQYISIDIDMGQPKTYIERGKHRALGKQTHTHAHTHTSLAFTRYCHYQ